MQTVTVKGRGLGEVIEASRGEGEEWSVRIKWANGLIGSFPLSKVFVVLDANRPSEPTFRTTRTGRLVREKKWATETRPMTEGDL
jgi:hypothetical protein